VSRPGLPLPQLARKGLSQVSQLISKAGASVEVEVPSVARKAPVPNVDDLPVGRRFEVNDEIHATTIWAADITPAEGHSTTVPNTTDLPGREPERDQDRIKDLRNQAWTTLSRPRWNRAWFNPRLSLVWLARPRHDWWMVSEAGPTTPARVSAKVEARRVSFRRTGIAMRPF
jgi:hypothetical protein